MTAGLGQLTRFGPENADLCRRDRGKTDPAWVGLTRARLSAAGRFVRELGTEPALRVADRHTFAPRVADDLVFTDATDREVARERVSEVKPADAGRRRHR